MNPILLTLSYFDLFDYPLTLLELKRYLFKVNTSVSEILKSLSSMLEIETRRGFYFLKGRGEIVDRRLERYRMSIDKFKKARFISRIISLAPGAQAIAISNRLSYRNSDREGDIDLFIVTEKNKIWTARFWVVSFLAIFRLRPPKHGLRKDKICTNFFVTEDNLNLEPLAYENDVHFACWASQLLPIYDPENLFEEFYNENQWIKEYIPNWIQYKYVRAIL